jgi:hypothetical protein
MASVTTATPRRSSKRRAHSSYEFTCTRNEPHMHTRSYDFTSRYPATQCVQQNSYMFFCVCNVPSILSEMEAHRLFQRFGPLQTCVITRIFGPNPAWASSLLTTVTTRRRPSVGSMDIASIGHCKLRVHPQHE